MLPHSASVLLTPIATTLVEEVCQGLPFEGMIGVWKLVVPNCVILRGS
jgi:hypothetical protein